MHRSTLWIVLALVACKGKNDDTSSESDSDADTDADADTDTDTDTDTETDTDTGPRFPGTYDGLWHLVGTSSDFELNGDCGGDLDVIVSAEGAVTGSCNSACEDGLAEDASFGAAPGCTLTDATLDDVTGQGSATLSLDGSTIDCSIPFDWIFTDIHDVLFVVTWTLDGDDNPCGEFLLDLSASGTLVAE